MAVMAIDSVIHFAGYKNPGDSMREPERYFENNVVGTARLLQAIQAVAKEKGVTHRQEGTQQPAGSTQVAQDASHDVQGAEGLLGTAPTPETTVGKETPMRPTVPDNESGA